MTNLLRTRLRPAPARIPVVRPEEARAPAIDIIEAGGVRWIAIGRSRAEERAWLEEHFDFHPLAYEDLVSRNQRPKVDDYGDYLFIVLYVPSYDKATGRLSAVELDMFVGHDYLITVPSAELPSLARLFERYRAGDDLRATEFAKGTAYLLYRVLDAAVDASFPMLRMMGNKLDQIEDDLFEGRSDQIVRDISGVKQEIINFRKIVRPQRGTYRDLERAVRQGYVSDELDLYFDDLTDASERIWDVLETYRELVDSLESTNEAVLSHRLNDTIRVLTAFSVVLLPLTLVASVFGMNVKVPGEGETLAFWIIVLGMVIGLVTLLGYFRYRRWL
ncbi:MAG TPA: magnesium transporter CorA family protein [Candidatus Limnocylindrales bacterium]